MDRTSARTVGIPWYGPEDYREMRGAMQDADKLPESYAYWLSSAESVVTAVEAGGTRVLRIRLELAPFLAWCGERGLAPNGQSRARWASEMAAESAGP